MLKTRTDNHHEEEEHKHNPFYRLFHRSEPNLAQTIGGVFYPSDDEGKEESEHHHHPENLSRHASAKGFEDAHEHITDYHHSWRESGARNHLKGAPVLAKTYSRQRLNPEHRKLSEKQYLGRILMKSRNGPKYLEYFAIASNHVIVNEERIKRVHAPLKRIPDMDELARRQARKMADEQELFHSDPDELHDALVAGHYGGRRVGENVSRGKNLKKIHAVMMKSRADRNNILDTRYKFMGMGTAKAADGVLYLCQLFAE